MLALAVSRAKVGRVGAGALLAAPIAATTPELSAGAGEWRASSELDNSVTDAFWHCLNKGRVGAAAVTGRKAPGTA